MMHQEAANRARGQEPAGGAVFALHQMSFSAASESGAYDARGFGYGLKVSAGRAVFVFGGKGGVERAGNSSAGRAASANPLAVAMSVAGANEAAGPEPEGLLPGVTNYLTGSDPRKWRTNLSNYSRVKYRSIYDGIDMVYYGKDGRLEYDFEVEAMAEPAKIRLGFENVESVDIASDGDLVLRLAGGGEMRQLRPVAYQETGDGRIEVQAGYRKLSEREVGFDLGDYDRGRRLVIDPVLIFSTLLGGNDDDFCNGIVADTDGNSYATGVTYSADFPIKNQYQIRKDGLGNAWAAKFDSSGRLIYSTYLGGSGEDVGFTIGIDSARNVYVAGSTDSSDFPVTSAAFQTRLGGRIDGFLTKLGPNGDSVVYSSFLGGANDDIINHIAIDASNNACVVGETVSGNFPTFPTPQSQLNGQTDSFVAKFNATGGGLIFSTVFGGSNRETAFGVALDSTNNVWVTGFTYSPDFPTRSPLQPALASSVDAFITKFDAAGRTILFSTFYGGSTDDGGFGIDLDRAGNIYVTGFTFSQNFPVKNAFQPQNRGGDDAFILKITPAYQLAWASHLGGSGDDRAFDLAVDLNGNSYITGRTESPDFNIKDAIQPVLGAGRTSSPAASLVKTDSEGAARLQSRYGKDPDPTGAGLARVAVDVPRDAFVAKIDTSGNLVYSTFLGGSAEEKGFCIAVDNRGSCYVGGLTASQNFPTKMPFQGVLKGILDAFIARISDANVTQVTVSAASYFGGNFAPESIVAAFGTGMSPVTQKPETIPLPTTIGGVSVQLQDSAGSVRQAPIFYLSPQQLNYMIPRGATPGPARVSVWDNGVMISGEEIRISSVSPGIFAANADGKGVAAALALRVKSNGSGTYEEIIRYDPAASRFVAVPIDLGATNSGDTVYLVLFATGVRYRSSLSAVSATIGGEPMQIDYAGAQPDYQGLDQINIPLPRSLAGRGEVNVVVTVDGIGANVVKVSIR